MGLMLFPGDGDTSSPDVAWSYSGFAAFRQQLGRVLSRDQQVVRVRSLIQIIEARRWRPAR